MELWEAMKLLQEGKKVRKKSWSKNDYIFLDKDVGLMDNIGHIIPASIERTLFADMFEPWEEYEKRTVDKWLNPTYYEYGNFSCECPICHKITLITKTPEFPNLIYYCMYCGTKNIVKE